MSAAMVDRRCECCSKQIRVRAADARRGWGRFCSKSCKARKQEARTGQYAKWLADEDHREYEDAMDSAEFGWDGHKGYART